MKITGNKEFAVRELSREEIAAVAGGDKYVTYVDKSDGATITERWSDDGKTFYGLTADYSTAYGASGSGMASSDWGFDLNWFGGGWAASGLGAGVSGGGGESSASTGFGLGVGFEIGFSTDAATAAQEGDNTDTQWGFDVNLDFDPFTFSIEYNAGAYQPVLEMHNDGTNQR